MRISIFSNLDLYSNVAINYLLDELRHHQFNLYLTYKVGSNRAIIPPLRTLGYFENDFVINHLFPFMEKNEPGGFMSFSQMSKRYGAELSFIKSVNDPQFLSKLREFNPDLIIVIRFGKILKGEVLSIPNKGIINLHSAILPNYRGVMGTFRALQAGDKNIGASIHYISDDTIDTGAIIKIINLPIYKDKSVLWHTVSLYPAAIKELITIIKLIANNKPITTKPQSGDGSYFSFPSQLDFEVLKKKFISAFNQEEYAELLTNYYWIKREWVIKTIRADKEAGNLNFEL